MEFSAWQNVDAWRRQVDQFAVITARPRLGTWSIITSPVQGTKFLILQFTPRTSAGQVNICHDFCPICANHYNTMAKALQNKKSYGGPCKSLPPADQKFLAPHWWGDNWPRSQSRSSCDGSKLINLAASGINILSSWKLNVQFIGLQREKLHTFRCDFSAKYCW